LSAGTRSPKPGRRWVGGEQYCVRIDRSGRQAVRGGLFGSAGGTAANRIACWDPAAQTWSALGSGMDAPVHALTVLDGKLYAGGEFTMAGDVAASRVACWDPANSAWSAVGSGMDRSVSAMTALDGRLYAGGTSLLREEPPQTELRAGSGCSNVVCPGVRDGCRRAGPDGSRWQAVCGRPLHHGGGVAASRVACWDSAASAWSALGLGTDRFVAALAALDGELYVGGDFTTVDGVVAEHIASWDPAARLWSVMGSGWMPACVR